MYEYYYVTKDIASNVVIRNESTCRFSFEHSTVVRLFEWKVGKAQTHN